MKINKLTKILFAAMAASLMLGVSDVKAMNVSEDAALTSQEEPKVFGDYQYIYNEEYSGIEILKSLMVLLLFVTSKSSVVRYVPLSILTEFLCIVLSH